MPTGPFTANDEDITVEISEIESGEAEHQVFDNLQSIGIAESAAISTTPGLAPPAVVIEDTPFEANNAEAIATLSNPPQEPPAPETSAEQSFNSAQSPPSHTQLQSSLALASSSLVASAIVDAYSSTHMANPPPLNFRKAGWSSLPPELREEIYKELLLVDMRQEQKDLCHHHLHLNILRVNKEIHEEASDILYLRNTWVQISMDDQVQRHVEYQINDFRHRKGRPEIRLYPGTFSGVAALNIVVNDKGNPNLPRHTCIISSFAMPQVCRMLTMPPTGTGRIHSLGLELDLATAPDGAVWEQKGLLDCFVETRGLESLKYTKNVAMLAEGRGKDGLVQLGAMALPLNNPAEVMERALTYLNRGRQHVRAKQIYEAITTFQEGAYYVHWLAYNPYGMSLEMMADSRMNIQLESNLWELIEECVSCCMQLGDMTWARYTLLFLFKGAYRPPKDKLAEA